METTLNAMVQSGTAPGSSADMAAADAVLRHALGRHEQVEVQLTAPVRIPYTAGSESCRAMALSALRRVPDVCRNSFAAYHAAHFRNLHELQWEMGHRYSPLLRTRHISPVSREAAERFRQLTSAKQAQDLFSPREG